MSTENVSILDRVRANLKSAGPKAWEDIERLTSVSRHTCRKIAYGDRKNPTLEIIQPIDDYFAARPELRAAEPGVA